jgi:hypothetical protein
MHKQLQQVCRCHKQPPCQRPYTFAHDGSTDGPAAVGCTGRRGRRCGRPRQALSDRARRRRPQRYRRPADVRIPVTSSQSSPPRVPAWSGRPPFVQSRYLEDECGVGRAEARLQWQDAVDNRARAGHVADRPHRRVPRVRGARCAGARMVRLRNTHSRRGCGCSSFWYGATYGSNINHFKLTAFPTACTQYAPRHKRTGPCGSARTAGPLTHAGGRGR